MVLQLTNDKFDHTNTPIGLMNVQRCSHSVVHNVGTTSEYGITCIIQDVIALKRSGHGLHQAARFMHFLGTVTLFSFAILKS
jgi:hypothetical protein